ncbi:uncharacterized protein BX664DRAFT_336138 [Halteromyces radiatus]|uniref:uncharacterized protein n=1 Tax=Halteromyces radiatus TaxID=101107 RepID=UPI002220E6D9|nr:uncharacterized protein BX664DRAFT_336138 [Halteromyces radiatus]KAI8086555.1 hypothetical protein BX664DRAFT_336138 [Halteromyces radiatus]
MMNPSLVSTTGTTWSSHVDVLNKVMDPIDILTDAELQNELALYANAQFTFDTLPGAAIEDKQMKSLSGFPMDQQRQHRQRPPVLDISLANQIHSANSTQKDPYSSVTSSPYDQTQQHYFTPVSSLPGSPTHKNHGGRHMDPLLSFMMSPTNSTPEEPVTPMETLSDQLDGHKTKKKSITRRTSAKSKETNDKPQDVSLEKVSQANEQQDEDLIKLDKRRRNTAASARFRIKKKLREQTLQRTACEMTEKAKRLEARVQELEREIKWLKELVVAKHDA